MRKGEAGSQEKIEEKERLAGTMENKVQDM
jgi:hypothetical protein